MREPVNSERGSERLTRCAGDTATGAATAETTTDAGPNAASTAAECTEAAVGAGETVGGILTKKCKCHEALYCGQRGAPYAADTAEEAHAVGEVSRFW